MTRGEDQAMRGFVAVWRDLFRGSSHLDSALSRQAPEIKSELARAIQTFLRRPVSASRELGVALPLGLPWSLSAQELADWPGARAFFDAMRSEGSSPAVQANEEDFPPWLISDWDAEWGEEVRQKLVAALAQDPPLSLRASRRIGSTELIERLRKVLPKSVRAAPSQFAPFGVVLSEYAAVLKSEAYKEGLFEIQDEGSQLMSLFALWPGAFGKLLQPAPGGVPEGVNLENAVPSSIPAWTAVDACAGAGGKTLAIADALQGRGRVFAYDTSPGKVFALRKRASRAGLRNIQATPVEENREEELVHRFRRRANMVLVDAPCSGWGVLRRNPDIKWRRDDATLARMPGLQRRILSVYSDLVAPGGSLVFGVCTFRKAETHGVVQWFLERNPDFKALEGGFLGPGPTDGFFMQRFQRDGGSQ